MRKECIFCKKDQNKIIYETELSKAFFDSFPVNKGVRGVIPNKQKY